MQRIFACNIYKLHLHTNPVNNKTKCILKNPNNINIPKYSNSF